MTKILLNSLKNHNNITLESDLQGVSVWSSKLNWIHLSGHILQTTEVNEGSNTYWFEEEKNKELF